MISSFNLLSKLADAGTLGLLLVLAIVAVVYLYKKLDAEKDKELDDRDKMILVLKSSNSTMRELLASIEQPPVKNNEKNA